MKNKLYKLISALFILVLFYAGNAFSQEDLTIHLMPVIPQSNYTNPAFMPSAKIHVGFPVMSSYYFGLSHSGFTYKDIVKRLPNDSLEITMDNMIDKLGKKNYLSANIMEELLSFGFKVKKNYFSFSLTEKVSFRFSYPRDLLSLVWKGNGQFVGNTADFSGIGINVIHYREYAVGYAREFTPKINVGIRLKFLQGLMNVSTKKNDISINIDGNDFAHTATTDFLINMALPEGVQDPLDTNKNTKSNFDFAKYITNMQNKGYGFDIGGSYKLNEKIAFGASLIDFGFIHWTTNVHNYSNTVESFKFDGLDINEFFNSDSTQAGGMENLADSISEIFKPVKTQNDYWASLPAKLYLTAIYSLTPHDKVGLLIRNEFFNKSIHPSLTLSYNKWFFKALSASASYSIMNRGFANIGFGL
ncbi:MAG: hypothetical protein HGB12_14055, partial [Bacteroidetes bacterium]|nr:hypothetical protein [Bacteroidota bacterium]